MGNDVRCLAAPLVAVYSHHQQPGAPSRGRCLGNDAKPTSRELRRPSCLVVRGRFRLLLLWACPLRGAAGVN